MRQGEHDTILPPPERGQHGGVELLPEAIADDEGRPSQPYRAIDILAAMERRGAITPEMRQAGEDFRTAFTLAMLDPLRAADMSRAMVSGRQFGPEWPAKARERVWAATLAVGGLSSHAGSVLWHVVGWERTLKEWARLRSQVGRFVSQHEATHILIAALESLERHFRGNR